jgi:hypothetical protein
MMDRDKNKVWCFILPLFFIPLLLYAQDGFGFGETGDFGFGSDGLGFQSPSGFAVKIGGDVSAKLTGFFNDFGSVEQIKSMEPGDIFSGSLNFEASGASAGGIIKLDLSPVFDGSSPVGINEAFVRAFFGPVTVEGGLRKLSWGKADSFGPLDVINPLDYSDLTKLSDPQSVKIARPMIRAAWSLGSFSKLEGVFVPWFEGHKFAKSGRWAPNQVKDLETAGIDIDDYYPKTYTLEYAQAGLRFTTSISSIDSGIQYYYGRLPRPAVNLRLTPYPEPSVNFNNYHQLGLDAAMVIAGFNIRAEAGVNVTGDLDGTDGTTENPHPVWSLGFDRDLFLGVNLNLQGTGRITLFHGEIGDSPLVDCQAGSDLTSTRITGIISRKFLRDELELKVSCLWGIEDKDFFVMPAITWSRNDVTAEIAAGFFAGDKMGELGQYRDNSFIRLGLSYSF